MPHSLTIALAGALALGLCAVALAGGATDADLIRMPPFEVNGKRPWLYAAVPGFEVLSLENANDTRRIAEDLQRAGRFMPVFFPPGTAMAPEVPATLFLDRFSGNSPVADAEKTLRANFRIGTFSPFGYGFASHFVSSNTVSAYRTGLRSIAGMRAFAIGAMLRPQPPWWYLDGLSALLAAADISERRIVFERSRWPITRTVQQDVPTIWTAPKLLPLEELLAVRSQEDSVAVKNTRDGIERYNEAATLLVHFCLFSADGARRKAFFEFVGAAEPPPDALPRHLGLTLEQLRTAMLEYGFSTGSRSLALPLAPEIAAVPLAPVRVLPATPSDVARLTGRAYLTLAGREVSGDAGVNRQRYLELARGALTENYSSQERHPEVVAALGYLAFHNDNLPEARVHLREAAAAGVGGPYLQFLLARLLFDEAGFTPTDGKPILAGPLAAILPPLRAALRLSPRLPEACQMLADLYLRSPEPVAAEDLALLAEAVRQFPELQSLRTKYTRLAERAVSGIPGSGIPGDGNPVSR